jgi:uncharacterized RDD family membrane protein YckC
VSICSECGSEWSSGAFCIRCGAELVPRAGAEAASRVAGFWIRAAARAIDAGVGFVAGALAGPIAIAALIASGHPGDPAQWVESASAPSPPMFAASMLGTVLYQAMSEWIGGASLGKAIFGLRVLAQDFRALPLLGALVRSFAILVDGLLFGLVGFLAMERSPLRQRLGDRWAGTIVVYARACPEARRGGLRVAFGIAAGVVVFTALCAYALVVRITAATATTLV